MKSLTLQAHAENYLNERRCLGFALRSTGYSVMSFARYVDTLNYQGPLTVEIMADWARRDHGNRGKRTTWARRLKKLRPFARYVQQFEPATEVPDDNVFGPLDKRQAPHIFSEPEIVDLLAAARCLRPPLRGATYETLFGLIAATGLRVSEAVHLHDTDVDLHQGRLTVRQTKFAKSRYVPLHPSTVAALNAYRVLRNRQIKHTNEMRFFVGTRGQRRGQRLSLNQVGQVFRALRDQLDWINRGTHGNPRIHDLRHTFIVHRVIQWQIHGVDVDQAMLALSTYVGHANVTNTYWYLTGIPELMAAAADKFASFMPVPEVSDE